MTFLAIFRRGSPSTPRTSPRTAGRTRWRSRKGFALLTVMLVSIVGAIIALASGMLAMSNVLIQTSSDRSAALDDIALSGLEEARARLNGKKDTVPLEGFGMIENEYLVPNSNGSKRTIWMSRLGNSDSLASTGQFGVQAELVSKVVDRYGNVVMRREQLYQNSFARYASFTDKGKGTNGAKLWWAMGAQAQGPVHSNDTIFVWNGNPKPQAIFHEAVTTARIVLNKSAAQYRKGQPLEKVAPIPMPTTADLNILKTIAAKAGYVFTPDITIGDSALVSMRIEFVAIDVNGDGNTTGADEGYFRVYKQRAGGPFDAGFLMGRAPAPPAGSPIPKTYTFPVDSMLYSRNCGIVVNVAGRETVPVRFSNIPVVPLVSKYADEMRLKTTAYNHPNAKCYLGGDDRLAPLGIFQAVDSAGYWMPRTAGSVPTSVALRPDGAYLFPLSAALNPDFRGVIFAEGRVGVSGTVRGRVTVASRKNMVLVHELLTATSPATTTVTCRPDDDIVGLFSGEYVLYADNTLATPQNRIEDQSSNEKWETVRKDFDPSSRRPDVTVHASVMALKSVAAERSSPPAGLPAASYVTRGTIRLIGGTVESSIGQTGTMSGSKLHGYFDDLSFNRCALNYPPPYFPTTGHWSRSQFYEVDPQGFDPAKWFQGR